MAADILWFVAVAGGPLILGGVIGYALARRRHLSRQEKATRDRATHQLYDREE